MEQLQGGFCIRIGEHRRLLMEWSGMPSFEVGFMRQLRVPAEGEKVPASPSLGTFPLRRVSDYANTVPLPWLEGDGFFLPIYQREAMWLSFASPRWSPFAVKVAVGGVNAISGREWSETLVEAEPPDYLDSSQSPWLDGFRMGDGPPRPLVGPRWEEGQDAVTVKLLVYPPKPGRFQPSRPDEAWTRSPKFRFPINDAKASDMVTRDLLEQGVITEAQLRDAERMAKQREDGVLLALLDMGCVEQHLLEEMAARANAAVLGIPYHDLKDLNPEFARLIPEHLAERYECVVVACEDNELALAMVDPTDLFAVDDIKLITGFGIQVAQASFSAVETAYRTQYGVSILDLDGETDFIEEPCGGEPGKRHSPDTWDGDRRACVELHLVNVVAWSKITGEAAPETPVNAVLYRNHGYPWLGEFEKDTTGTEVIPQ